MGIPRLTLACGLALTGLAITSIARADRPDTPGSMETFRFDAADVVEHVDFDAFRVHFTRNGTNAVPATDGDGDGTPDYVTLVGETYDEVLRTYVDEWGFRAPLGDDGLFDDDGGDARFDVYLIDFFGTADGSFQRDACSAGTCVGYMVQENDFVGYGYPSLAFATTVLASHELFHAVQAAYDDGQNSILGEGTAVWASERYDTGLNELRGFATGYLERPDRSIDQPLAGVVLDRFAYGSALFFQFLTERFGDDDIVRSIWEACAGDPSDREWQQLLPSLLEAEHGTSFAAAWTDFAAWNWQTAARANPSQSYARGIQYASVAMENVALPLEVERPRIFHASVRYYVFDPEDRTQIRVRLVGAPADVSPLRVRLAILRDDAVELGDVGTTDGTIVSDGDPIGLAVMHTELEGSSVRPVICAGAPDEVDACEARYRLTDAGVDLDASVDAAIDASFDGGVGADAGMMSGGGGCSTAGGTALPWLLPWLLLWLPRRRIRRG